MSNYGINSYINSINQATSSGVLQNGKGSLSDGAKNAIALGKSNAGDVITGEVVKVNGKTVQIQLDGNNVITAKVENNMNVSVGQSLAFEVRSNTNGQISLSPLFTNTTMNPAMIKAITMASLPLSEQTISMTSTMMDNGLGIDRQSMQQMYAMINEFPGADSSTLVSMKAMGIDINPQSIEQFEIYKNNEHQILNATEELSDALCDVINELPLNESSKILDTFSILPDKNLLDGMKNELNEENAINTLPVEEEVQNENYVGPFGASFADANKAAEEPAEAIPLEEPVSEEFTMVADQEAQSELTKLISPEERELFAKTLSELGLPKESVNSILDGSADPQKVMGYIRTAMEISSSDMSNNEGMHKILSTKGFSNLLKEMMGREWTIRADENFSKDTLRSLYEKIESGTEKLMNVLSAAGKGESQAAAVVSNMQQNLNFMHDINQLYQYVQVPIKMSDENAHGDLFVYTNKKKLSQKDGEVSALLHLEMKTLGTMDIHVALKDFNHVNTHFYLQDDSMLDFVSEHLGELDARLTERGYSMHSVASVREVEGANESELNNKAVATMLGLDKHKLMSKYSFDMRA